MGSLKASHSALLLFLGFVCFLVFFHGLGDYGLWDPDEGRSGIIAKEIVTSGNWLTLTQNGNPYRDKPVFYFWLVAVGFKLLGFNEWAVRLPSALAATVAVGGVSLWGYLVGGWKLGLWSGLVLATSLEFAALGRFGNTDMVFVCFFSTALLYFLWWKRQRRRWIWPFYLLLGFASLTKGPAGILLPLLIVGISLGLSKEWHLVRELRPLRGVIILMSVSGSWYLAAALQDPEYIRSFLWDHNILRYVHTQPGINHPAPFYYLVLVLLGGFLPWTLLLPAALRRAWERRGTEGKDERRFLMVWAVTVLVFFSLSRNKLGTYILPAFPPLALLIADFLVPLTDGRTPALGPSRWAFFASLVWLSFLLALAPLSEFILGNTSPQYLPLSFPLWLALLFLLATAVMGVSKKARWAPWVLSSSSLALILWFYGGKVFHVSELRSARSLAQMVGGTATNGVRLVAIRSESFSFYVPFSFHEASHPAAVERLLGEPMPTLALVKEKHLEELDRHLHSRLFVWKSVPSANVLIANFPPPFAQDLGTTLNP